MTLSTRLLVSVATGGVIALSGLGAASAAVPGAAPGSTVASVAGDTQARREARAEDQARASLRASAPLGSRDTLAVADTMLDRDGASHVRFTRSFAGLEVVGGDVVVHQDSAGSFSSLSGRAPQLRLATRPTVPAARASRLAGRGVGFRKDSAKPELVVLGLGRAPRLAWRVDVRGTRPDGSPAGEYVFVSARGGARVLNRWPSILPEAGTGESLYSGTVGLDTVLGSNGVYSMVDPVRGAQRVKSFERTPRGGRNQLVTGGDNLWGDGTVQDRQTVAVDAQFGAAATWDYYLDRFGRVGIRDNGIGATSLVHTGNFTNAFWDDRSFTMVYGDGNKRDRTTPLVSLDVAGHEMSHGVTAATADLIYFGESGGLNEATSDIMGTNVEFAAGNTAPGTDVGDYLIGEEIFHYADESKNFLRRMDQPSLDGISQDCVNARTKKIDVHYSSGPANHFYYLLAEGSGARTINGVDYDSPTCNNAEIVGIGRAEAERIWYRGLTTYMTPRTNYRGAMRATTQAARDLYGAGSVEEATTKAAWAAVRVS